MPVIAMTAGAMTKDRRTVPRGRDRRLRLQTGRPGGAGGRAGSMGPAGRARLILPSVSDPHEGHDPGRRTESGTPIKPVYGPEDLADFDPARALGEPGAYPYTRGVYPSMYTSHPWTMRQYAGFGTAAESNARYRELTAHGTTGLSVAFDLPTQMGMDSDAPLAAGEVGKVGVAIDSLDDMRVLLDEIPLGEVSTSMTINAPAARAAAALPAGGRGAGHRPGEADRHHPERRAEGVHRPRHLHLPAGPLAAPGQRYVRLLRGAPATVEHHLDLRLPHGRGGGDAGAGGRVHPGQRDRVRPGGPRRRAGGGRHRAAAVVLLRRPAPACWRRWPSSGPPGGSGPG